MDDAATAAVGAPVDDRRLEQELAEQLLERARAEGVQLTGPNGLLAEDFLARMLNVP